MWLRGGKEAGRCERRRGKKGSGKTYFTAHLWPPLRSGSGSLHRLSVIVKLGVCLTVFFTNGLQIGQLSGLGALFLYSGVCTAAFCAE